MMRTDNLLTEDDLVEMFSSLPTERRKEILADLKKSMLATGEDFANTGDESIKHSLHCLTIMEKTCQQAEAEFVALGKETQAP